jgi:hypothetical protein
MILVHCGELGAARLELRAYMASMAFRLSDGLDQVMSDALALIVCTIASVKRTPLFCFNLQIAFFAKSTQQTKKTRLPRLLLQILCRKVMELLANIDVEEPERCVKYQAELRQ